jgi:predicted kinase
MLIILGGLPGVGKTTISRLLAKEIRAFHLRIDTIETAIKRLGLLGDDADKAGYLIAYEIAKDNLLLGQNVIADSVNPIDETRNSWKSVAKAASSKFLDVEIICSDTAKHKRNIENRTSDIEGQKLPSWQEVQNRNYTPKTHSDLVVDTAKLSNSECINKIITEINKLQG